MLQILILDDDPQVANAIGDFVRDNGHAVVAAVTTAEDALYVGLHAPIDLLIADIDLGGGPDGTHVATELHQRTGVKTIFVTGRSDPGARDRAQEAWPLAFIVKPIDPAVLRGVLRNAVDELEGPRRSFG